MNRADNLFKGGLLRSADIQNPPSPDKPSSPDQPSSPGQPSSPDQPSNPTNPTNNGKVTMTRRGFIQAAVAAALLSSTSSADSHTNTDALKTTALSPETVSAPTEADYNEVLRQPLSARTVNVFGMLVFADAIASVVTQTSSVLEKVLSKNGIGGHNQSDVHDAHDEHSHYFPALNMKVILLLNGLRMGISPEARAGTVHAAQETAIGATLLTTLTAIYSEGLKTHELALDPPKRAGFKKVMQMAFTDLSVGAFVTANTGATGFGSASLGNNALHKVKIAVEQVFNGLLPDGNVTKDQLLAHLKKIKTDDLTPDVVAIINNLEDLVNSSSNAHVDMAKLQAIVEEEKRKYFIKILNLCDNNTAWQKFTKILDNIDTAPSKNADMDKKIHRAVAKLRGTVFEDEAGKILVMAREGASIKALQEAHQIAQDRWIQEELEQNSRIPAFDFTTLIPDQKDQFNKEFLLATLDKQLETPLNKRAKEVLEELRAILVGEKRIEAIKFNKRELLSIAKQLDANAPIKANLTVKSSKADLIKFIQGHKDNALWHILDAFKNKRKKQLLSSIYSGAFASADSIAAPAGDLGPVIALLQVLGFKNADEALKTILTTYPFTLATVLDRYLMLNYRAGTLAGSISHLKEDLTRVAKEWWKNAQALLQLFWETPHYKNAGNEPLLEYSRNQIGETMQRVIDLVVEAVLGSIEELSKTRAPKLSDWAGRRIDRRRLEDAVKILTEYSQGVDAELGRRVRRARAHGDVIDRDFVRDVTREIEAPKMPYLQDRYGILMNKLTQLAEETGAHENSSWAGELKNVLTGMSAVDYREFLGHVYRLKTPLALINFYKHNPEEALHFEKAMVALENILSDAPHKKEEAPYTIRQIYISLSGDAKDGSLGDASWKKLENLLQRLDGEHRATIMALKNSFKDDVDRLCPHEYNKIRKGILDKKYKQLLEIIGNLDDQQKETFVALAELHDPDMFWLQVELLRLAFKPTSASMETFLDKQRKWSDEFQAFFRDSARKFKANEGDNILASVLALLAEDNATLARLLDMNQWIDRIGSTPIAETALMVPLQGMSLPFLLDETNQIFNMKQFQEMPLQAKLLAASTILYVLGGFLDNWAITAAGLHVISKSICSNDLDEKLYSNLSNSGLNVAMEKIKAAYTINPHHNLVDFFKEKKEQTQAFMGILKQQYPDKAGVLDDIIKDYLKRTDEFFNLSKHLAFGIGYMAGEQYSFSDSTHFALLNGLGWSTAESMTPQHPLYQVWKFFTVFAYHSQMGPWMEKVMFGSRTEGATHETPLKSALKKLIPGLTDADFLGIGLQ